MKAVCFSAATGGGHNAAAQGVAQALTSLGVKADCLDCLRFAGERMARAVEGAYVGVVRNYPSLFGKIYRAGAFVSSPRRKSPVYYANALYRAVSYTHLDVYKRQQFVRELRGQVKLAGGRGGDAGRLVGGGVDTGIAEQAFECAHGKIPSFVVNWIHLW